MPYLERCCIETKRVEYREVLDVTRILHMLQKKHIITPQLEAIVLADPGFTGRVDRLLDILMSRGPQVNILSLSYCRYSLNYCRYSLLTTADILLATADILF